MSWLHDKTKELLARIHEAKEKKAFPFFRQFENVGTRVRIGHKSYINFTSNDYLGLSQHRDLIQASIAGIRKFGTGLGSARPQANTVRHEELEARLASWLSKEACVVFTTGYQCIVGVLSAFCDGETTVVVDKLSHASILDGVSLAQGNHPELEVRFFNHNSVARLRKVLETAERPNKLVVVEGLYSIDGDVAPLDQIVEVCQEFGAALMVDDAHGLGALGHTGRGVGEIYNCLDKIDLLVGTFSKSFGSVGGFVCADRDLIEYMKLAARSFMYSASLPIAQVEAALAALDIIESDYSTLRRLSQNGQFFREGLLQLGFDVGDSTTHITPIMIGDEEQTIKAGAYLFHGGGVIMLPFVYPGAPRGKARLRANVTAAHNRSDLGYTLEVLARVGQELNLIPAGSKTGASRFKQAVYLADSKFRALRNAGVWQFSDEAKQIRDKVETAAKTVKSVLLGD